MRPTSRVLSSDIADYIAADPVLLGKIVEQAPASWLGANSRNISLRQFCILVGRAALRMGASVRDHIRHILFTRRPPQIAPVVICSTPVLMSNVILSGFGRAVECLANKPVNFHAIRFASSIDMQREIAVAVDMRREQMTNSSTLSRKAATYISDLRNLVFRSARAHPPFEGFIHAS